MKVTDIKCRLADEKEYVINDLDVSIMSFIDAVEDITDYEARFPVLSMIIEGSCVYIWSQTINDLLNELKNISELKQYLGLENKYKQIKNELKKVKANQKIQFWTTYKEFEVSSVAFTIYTGDVNPNVITECTHTTPTKIAIKGDTAHSGDKHTAVRNKHSYWRLESDLPSEADVEAHVARLLAVCRPRKQEFIECSKKYDGLKVSVGVRFYNWNPQFEFEPELIRELGEYGATLWLDMYTEQNSQIEDALGNPWKEN